MAAFHVRVMVLGQPMLAEAFRPVTFEGGIMSGGEEFTENSLTSGVGSIFSARSLAFT